MGAFLAWIIRDYIGDLQKSRDRSLTMAESSALAIDRLTTEIAKLRGELESKR
jgi:hypothetical protein